MAHTAIRCRKRHEMGGKKNAVSIGADTLKGFLVGGAEAGAHIAAVCAVRARNRHPNIEITGQNLIVPVTCGGPNLRMLEHWLDSLTSHEENKDATVFDQRMFQMFVDALGMSEDEMRSGENIPCGLTSRDSRRRILPWMSAIQLEITLSYTQNCYGKPVFSLALITIEACQTCLYTILSFRIL